MSRAERFEHGLKGPAEYSLGWADLGVGITIIAFWVLFVLPLGQGRFMSFDAYRDAGAAINVQYGQPLADPAYRGQTAWYPPLGPVLAAAAASVLRCQPLEVYRWAGVFINWLLPTGLFLVVRLAWGFRAGLVATVALMLAVPWWQTQLHHGLASFHGVIGGWIALLLYARQYRAASMGWAVVCGVFQGIAFWQHPIVPAVLTLMFAGGGIWSYWRSRTSPEADSGRGVLKRHGMMLGISMLFAAPAVYLMATGPILNSEPGGFLAPELATVRFALMGANPWLWAMGALGIGIAVKEQSVWSRLLLIGLCVCGFAQLPAYARLYSWPGAGWLPSMVPHEFQRLFQLCWTVAVGIGVAALIRWISARTSRAAGRVGPPVLLAFSLAITGTWGLLHVHQNLRFFLDQEKPTPPALERAGAWVRDHTSINDVFMIDPKLAFKWLNPTTGRKVWLTLKGHSNPRVNWTGRLRLAETMWALDRPEAFWSLLREQGIDYVVLNPGFAPRVLTGDYARLSVPAYFEPCHVDPKAIIILKTRQRPLTVGSTN